MWVGGSPRIALLSSYSGANLGDGAIHDAAIAGLTAWRKPLSHIEQTSRPLHQNRTHRGVHETLNPCPCRLEFSMPLSDSFRSKVSVRRRSSTEPNEVRVGTSHVHDDERPSCGPDQRYCTAHCP